MKRRNGHLFCPAGCCCHQRRKSSSRASSSSSCSSRGGCEQLEAPPGWCVYLAVGLVAVGAYLNALPADFVHDDIPAIVRNKDVLGQNPLLGLLKDDFWGVPMHDPASHKSYRPLTTLSFRFVESPPSAQLVPGRRPREAPFIKPRPGDEIILTYLLGSDVIHTRRRISENGLKNSSAENEIMSCNVFARREFKGVGREGGMNVDFIIKYARAVIHKYVRANIKR